MTDAWDDDVDSDYPDPRYLPMDLADLGGTPRRYTVNGQDVTDTVAYFMDTERDWYDRLERARRQALANAHQSLLLNGTAQLLRARRIGGPGQALRDLTAWARGVQVTMVPTPGFPMADPDDAIGGYNLHRPDSGDITVTLHADTDAFRDLIDTVHAQMDPDLLGAGPAALAQTAAELRSLLDDPDDA